jgi:hypothetical protein
MVKDYMPIRWLTALRPASGRYAVQAWKTNAMPSGLTMLNGLM